MTASVTPDFPDWVPGQSVVAADRLLLQDTIDSVQIPYQTALLDATPWSSALVRIIGDSGLGGNVAHMTVEHYIGGLLAYTDGSYFTVLPPGSGGDFGVLMRIPLLGDQFRVGIDLQQSAGSYSLAVTASTRPASRLITPASIEQPVPLSISKSLLLSATSTTEYGQMGPWANGIHIASSFVAAGVGIRLDAQSYQDGAWVSETTGSCEWVAGGRASADILCPGLVCQVLGYNTTTGSHTLGIVAEGY